MFILIASKDIQAERERERERNMANGIMWLICHKTIKSSGVSVEVIVRCIHIEHVECD